MENTDNTNSTSINAGNIDNSYFIEQGWQCPVCKAVMSPKERMCVNCNGINLYGKVTTFPETVKIYYDTADNTTIIS